MKQSLNGQLNSLIGEYAQRPLRDYSRFPLKYFVVKLQKSKLPEYADQACQAVREACYGIIADLEKQKRHLKDGLQNQTLQ